MTPSDPMPALFVINPNSTQAVTTAMDQSLEALRLEGAPELRCVTLEDGPPGIETDEHIRDVVEPLIGLVRRLDSQALGFVDACFSDPGLAELRSATQKPIYGIAECAYRFAAEHYRRFGVVSILEVSVVRHRQHIARLGLLEHLAGDRAIDQGVTELGGDTQAALSRMSQVGKALRDRDRAQAVILGCAGMARFRGPLENSLSIPVIDPVMVAVEVAIKAMPARTVA